MQTSFYIWKAFHAVNSPLRIQMPPRTPFTWHLMIMSKVKVVIHDIIFVFRARTGISFTWPFSCGKYLPSVMLNIMMTCVNVHRSSLTKNVMIFFKGVDKTRNMEHSGTCRYIPEHPGTWKNKNDFHKKKNNKIIIIIIIIIIKKQNFIHRFKKK